MPSTLLRLLLALSLCAGGAATAAAADFEKTVAPFLTEHCTLCHGSMVTIAGLNLSVYHDSESAASADIWDKVLAKLSAGEMPPAGQPRPDKAALEPVLEWLDTEVARRRKEQSADPGRVTARRLNRQEYNNTIRDLLGIDLRPADDFPADDSGYGFDNIGDVLSLSPVLMERYLTAAERVAQAAIVVDREVPVTQEVFRPETEVGREGEAVWPAAFEASYDFPTEADYEVKIPIGGSRPTLTLFQNLSVWLDGALLGSYEVRVGDSDWRKFEFLMRLPAGQHTIRAELIDDYSNVDDARGEPPGPNTRERNFVIDAIQITGPYDQAPRPVTASHRRIFICGERGRYDTACTDRILRNLARRAFRRPVNDVEVERLHGLVRMAMEDGASWEEGVQVALQAVLVSPHFLFRIERDADPNDPDAAHEVSDFELASRLSYFLWSSMPDEELFRLARLGLLREPEVLETQVRRMLADERSDALVENFAGQWLQLRNLTEARPDPEKFPDFDDSLRQAMRRETELFFSRVMREDRSILELIDGNYTYLNERLARHYGIEGVMGNHFRRVSLDGEQRSGVLTQASILTVSSYPTRTSPVLRGLWVLENFLGTPPPPPPPDVPALNEEGVGITGTLREQLVQHRANPACAVCHDRIDPLGFGLENYDPVGRWRTHEGRFAIDSAGTLPNGQSFKRPSELKEILKSNAGAFTECVTEKLLTYALGRGLESYDIPRVEAIAKTVAGDHYRFSRLVLEIVRSTPFQMRRGDREEGQS